MRCWGAVGCWCVTFFALLGLLVAETVQSSPCWRKMGRNRRFGACQASFVPGWPPSRACWESSVPGGPASRAAGRVLYRLGPSGVCAGRVLYRKWLCVRDKVRPACRVGGGNGTKFSLLAQNGPKSAFWGVLGEFCTGSGSACGIKFALLGLMVGECAKKFAQRTKNSPKSAVCGVLGEFFRESAGERVALGELFRG